jgi:hypothetical protein
MRDTHAHIGAPKSKDSQLRSPYQLPENHVEYVIGPTQRSQPVGPVDYRTGQQDVPTNQPGEVNPNQWNPPDHSVGLRRYPKIPKSPRPQ